MIQTADISENKILKTYPSVLNILLRCHSRFAQYKEQHPNDYVGHEDECHIIWATDSYEMNGEGYSFHDQITAEKITGDKGNLIRPRILKSTEEQQQRVKDKAEVFTPSWVCNAQNNLVDNAWFGRDNVFNNESENDGTHTWIPNQEKINFEGTGKTWEDYVKDTRMEMTCGEAPYLTSRYDVVSGNIIPICQRIGILDRKLRIINENVDDKKEWIDWAKIALQNIYGFEWQGDNLLIARESIFFTVLDFFGEKFPNESLPIQTLDSFAYIISWNIWQMDGLKFVVPETCHDTIQEQVQLSLFDEGTPTPTSTPCPGCKTGDHRYHNGIKCRVKDWSYTGKFENKAKPYFHELVKGNFNIK